MSGNLGGTYESFLTRCIGGVRKELATFRELAKVVADYEALEEKGKALGLQEGWGGEGAEELMKDYLKGKDAFLKEGDVYSMLLAFRNLSRHREVALKRVEAENATAWAAKAAKAAENVQEAEKGYNKAEKLLRKAEKALQEAEQQKRKEGKNTKEKKEGCGCWLLVVLAVCLLSAAIVYWCGGRTAIPWLIFIPLAIVVVYYLRKRGKKREMEKTMARLEKTVKNRTAMLEERKAEAEKAKSTLAEAQAELKETERWIQSQVLGEGTIAGETKTFVLPGGAVMEMVWCPPGTFMMGHPEDEDSGVTLHEVTLTKGFWMGKTEVTQAQWKSVMGNNPSEFKGDNLPVENVSWDDCQQFCKKTGLQLPTEAQWEYACRAGSTGPYAGTGNLEEMGWYVDNSDDETHPVGTKQPNAWGLYDMHGNVCEWCADWWGDYPNDAVTDPQGASSGWNRVVRGGSWCFDAGSCASSYRDYACDPSDADNYVGFRLVRTLSE